MDNKILVTYSLLTHIKETRITGYSNIAELFFPIVKKSLYEYAKERGNDNVKGKNISEIQSKILEYFGINIPPAVLHFILCQINKEISNDNIFAYYQDRSFIINTYIFNDIDEEIQIETDNVNLLKLDFESFCISNSNTPNFDELIRFICSQKMNLISIKEVENLDFPYYIPQYVSLKFNDEKYFKNLSDIYLGSLISSYFEFKISTPVTNTELLIDTNFFISLIDLNTYEAFLTCNKLHELCDRLGYQFTILFSTLDEINSLLNYRIQDFASKDIGLVKDTDIFGACVRRKLDKTQLERIKDNIDDQLRKYKIKYIPKEEISTIVDNIQETEKYKHFLEIRNQQKLSALNDTIAYYYVNQKRGNNIQEFADVKCWFLNNSFNVDYHIGLGYKLHERYTINASELLTLLWLANPDQDNIDFRILTKGGLATYIAKYKQNKIPSINTIKDINERAKKALHAGKLSDRDVFAISIRMAEGQLTEDKAIELIEMPDEDFIRSVKKFSYKIEEVLTKITEQGETISKLYKNIEDIQKQNILIAQKFEDEKEEKERTTYVDKKILDKSVQLNKITWIYLVFIILISSLWLLNHFYFEIIESTICGIISFVLFIISIFIRLVNHTSVLNSIKFTFFKNYRLQAIEKFRDLYANEYKEHKP